MLKSRDPGPDSLTRKNMVVRHWQIISQELLTGPDCATESAKSVSTSRPGSHRREGGSYSTGKNLLLSLLGFIACLNLLIRHE